MKLERLAGNCCAAVAESEHEKLPKVGHLSRPIPFPYGFNPAHPALLINITLWKHISIHRILGILLFPREMCRWLLEYSTNAILTIEFEVGCS